MSFKAAWVSYVRSLSSEGQRAPLSVDRRRVSQRSLVAASRTTILLHLLPAAIAVLAIHAEADAKGAKTAFVDCAQPGASLQFAINGVAAGVPTTIAFSGICSEDVTIRSDAITLSGDPDGLGLRGGAGTIDGTVTVAGANNVILKNLKVTGSGPGIKVTDSASVYIQDNILDGNEFEGISVINSAFAEISGTDVTDNDQAHSFGRGIIVQRNAAAVMKCNNVVSGNGDINGQAVYLEEGGALRQQLCAGGELDIIEARSGIDGSTAIYIFNGSIVDIRGADVTGPIVIAGNSTFRVQSSDLTGDVRSIVGSLVGFRPNSFLTGTLFCDATSDIFGSELNLAAIHCGDTCSGAVATCSQ